MFSWGSRIVRGGKKFYFLLYIFVGVLFFNKKHTTFIIIAYKKIVPFRKKHTHKK